MKIIETFSHLNGLEHLLVRKKMLWAEIELAVRMAGGDACHVTGGTRLPAKVQPKRSAVQMHQRLKQLLRARGWHGSQVTHWVPAGGQAVLPPRAASAAAQKREIESAGLMPVRKIVKIDFVKDRVAINLPLKISPARLQYRFLKHLAFFVRDQIDVGVEILPMKALQHHMSSGPGYYEGELYNVIRNGRGVPSVPLVVIGIAP